MDVNPSPESHAKPVVFPIEHNEGNPGLET